MGDVLSGVGVVVVTYDSAPFVAECLAALPHRRLLATVVVDNASGDETASVVEALGIEGVTVRRSATNAGFGAACNAGAALMPEARHLLFLNPDAVIAPDCLESLASYLLARPSAAMVAPRLRRGSEPITSAGKVATLLTELVFALPHSLARRLPDRRHPPGFDRTGPVGCVEGACMLVDARAFREVGGFDERLFLFFEEHDLARRLRRAGRTVDLFAECWAHHTVAGSRAALPLEGRDHNVASTVAYLRKWYGPLGVALYRAVASTTWALQARTGRLDRADADRLRAALRGRGSPVGVSGVTSRGTQAGGDT